MSLFCGCAGPYRDTCIYQDSGKTKPIVVVLPVILSSSVENDERICWDLAEEFSEQIRWRIFDSSRLYLLRDMGDASVARSLNIKNLNALNHLHIEGVGAAEFVVCTELVKHEETPYKIGKATLEEAGAVLALDFRIRVIDIRGEHPKVILQELIHHDHFIARSYLHSDYTRSVWGTEAFERTPMGMAHSRMAREIVSRVESYIQIAKS
ncbi:MAG: hypothetical protein KDK55_05030 [Chlamydiia bacterium]|nr:hypothetical protein [Chlamydiia bacterium]